MQREDAFEAMRDEACDARRRGRWRSGDYTLMHAMGIPYREVYRTKGLAWMLHPDGWHGLGGSVLSRFLSEVGLPAEFSSPVKVETEETRRTETGLIRADLVVRVSGATVLVEAKVGHDERPKQCDDLATAWASADNLTLVFLTLDGREPETAVRSARRWKLLTWSRVAEIVDEVAREAEAAGDTGCVPAPGVREWLRTVETFGSELRVPADDDKIAFYLRNHELIEEWAAFRDEAVTRLRGAFDRAVTVVGAGPDTPEIRKYESGDYRTYAITLTVPSSGSASVEVALGWSRKELFKPVSESPFTGIKVPWDRSKTATDVSYVKDYEKAYSMVRDLLGGVARERGWADCDPEGSWPWWDRLSLPQDTADLDAYAHRHMNDLIANAKAVQSAVDELFT